LTKLAAVAHLARAIAPDINHPPRQTLAGRLWKPHGCAKVELSDFAASPLPSRSIMFTHAYLLPVAAALAIMTAPAQANIVISINKGSQTMSVSVDGQPSYRWAVSTARSG
jgi:hypothetical protein